MATGARSISTIVSALALLLLTSACGAEPERAPRAAATDAGAETHPASRRPNIILILTDDQDVASLDDMPGVQKHMVRRGISFTRAYSTTPICCPQRVSILRGQYVHNHGVKGVGSGVGGFARFVESGGEPSTIATWLRAAGYTTFLAGKYLNGYTRSVPTLPETYVPPGWDRWFGDLAPQDYFGYRANDNGVVVQYGWEEEDYLTDVLRGKAVDFIRSMAGQDGPFFLYLAPFAPHDAPPVDVPRPAPRHAEAFAGRVAPRPPCFNESDVADKSPHVRRWPRLDEKDFAALDRHHRLRLQTLLSVDELVEAIFAALADTGALSNTYVVYTSDSGFFLGQHRVPTGKSLPYEDDILVPFVVTGPGLEEGSRDHFVLLSDLAPTFVELAGADQPDWVDARSLVPLFRGTPPPAEDWRVAFAIEYWRPRRDAPDTLVWRGIRAGSHKYLELHFRDETYRELYDLARDPFELEGGIDGADASRVTELAAWLDDLFHCAGATCRELEDAPPGGTAR